MIAISRISVLGIWHLGLVQAVGFAQLGWSVIGFDEDQQKIKLLNQGKSPIFEPGLEQYLKKNLQRKQLSFTNKLDDVSNSQIVIIAYDTPLNEKDEVNLKSLFEIVQKLEKHLKNHTIVIISSQVPVGITEKIEAILNQNKKQVKVAYIPENLRLGKAMERFFKPSMIVIGTKDRETFSQIKKLYQEIKAPKIFTSIKTAEMVKHAINTFLANSISWANELGNLSDLVGADFQEVAEIIKKDERIGGYARISPGLGFAGGTLARDLKILQEIGDKNDYETEMIDAILKVNEKQKHWVIDVLKKIFGKKIRHKKIGILGLTYRPNTSTLRRSLAVEVIGRLTKLKANVVALDPGASQEDLKKYPWLVTVPSWKELASQSDVLVLMTEWKDFLNLPWLQIKTIMKQPVIIDAKNFLTDIKLNRYGFKYYGVGRGGVINEKI